MSGPSRAVQVGVIGSGATIAGGGRLNSASPMERRGSRRSRSPRRIPTSRTGSSAITRKRKAPATGRSEEHKMTAWDDWLRKLSADGKGGIGLRGQPQMSPISRGLAYAHEMEGGLDGRGDR